MDDNQKSGATSSQGGLSWSTPAQSKVPAHTNAAVPAPVLSAPTPQRTGVYAGILAAGVLVGIMLTWGWSSWRATPAISTATTTESALRESVNIANGIASGAAVSPAIAAGADPALSIMSPQPAGKSIKVDKAIVSSPTWIVVYDNKDGKPGNALGASLFFPEKQSGTVTLLRSTMPGKSYLAVKQVDNGDRKFSLRGDPYLSEGGVVQWVTFEAR